MGNQLIPTPSSDTIEVQVNRKKRHVVTVTNLKEVKTFFGRGRRKKVVAAYEQHHKIERNGQIHEGPIHKRRIAFVPTPEDNGDNQTAIFDRIEKRIKNNAKTVQFSQMAGLVVTLALTFGRGGFVAFERGNWPAAQAALTQPLPFPQQAELTAETAGNFGMNVLAALGNAAAAADNATNLSAAATDAALTARTIAGGIYNLQPFAHADGWRTIAAGGQVFGVKVTGEDRVNTATRAQKGNWLPALQGEDQLVTSYRGLYDELAVKDASDNVTYHEAIDAYAALSERVRQSSFEAGYGDLNFTNWLLAAADIVHEATANGFADRAAAEARLLQMGAAYLTAQRLQRPGIYDAHNDIYDADNDPLLQMLQAARDELVTMADANDPNAPVRLPNFGSETDRVLEIAQNILERTRRTDFENQASTAFGQGMSELSFQTIATNDEMMRTFLAQPAIRLDGVAGDMILGALATDTSARMILLQRFTEAGGQAGRTLQQARAEFRSQQQPQNVALAMLDSVWQSLPFVELEKPVQVATAAPPSLSQVATSLIFATNIQEGGVGALISAAITSQAPDLAAILRIADGETTIDELESAILTAAYADSVRDGNPPADAAALNETARSYMELVATNVLVSARYGGLSSRLFQGNSDLAPEAQAAHLLGTINLLNRIYDAAPGTQAGDLVQRATQTLGVSAEGLRNLTLFLLANEGLLDVQCSTPPVDDLNRSPFDAANMLGPVWGCSHFIEDTHASATVTGNAQGIIEDGFFNRVDRNLNPRGRSDVALSSTDQRRIIMLRAAFGEGYLFDFSEGKLRVIPNIRNDDFTPFVTYDFNVPDGLIAFESDITDRIQARFARLTPTTEDERYMWAPLNVYFAGGGQAGNLDLAAYRRAAAIARASEAPKRNRPVLDEPPIELLQFMALAYDQEATVIAKIGQWLNSAEELSGVLHRPAGGATLSERQRAENIGHLYMYHVFGGTLNTRDGWVDCLRAGRWTNELKATRNPFVTAPEGTRLSPQQAFEYKVAQIERTGGAAEFMEIMEARFPGSATTAATVAATRLFTASRRPVPSAGIPSAHSPT